MKIFITAIFALFCMTANAQFFINGDMEVTSDLHSPILWSGFGAEMRLDSSIKVSGDYSLRVNGKGIAAVVVKDYEVRDLYGKKIRLCAKIKNYSVDSTSLFLQILENGKSKDIVHSDRIILSDDWQDVDVQMEIKEPMTTAVLALGVLNLSDGVLLIDDLKLYADDKEVSCSVRTSDLKSSEKSWLSVNSQEIDEVSLNDVDVVGLGEETHNSLNIKKTRMEIADNLTKKCSFKIVLEELKTISI